MVKRLSCPLLLNTFAYDLLLELGKMERSKPYSNIVVFILKNLCYVYSALNKYTIVFNRGDDSSNKTTPKYSEKKC